MDLRQIPEQRSCFFSGVMSVRFPQGWARYVFCYRYRAPGNFFFLVIFPRYLYFRGRFTIYRGTGKFSGKFEKKTHFYLFFFQVRVTHTTDYTNLLNLFERSVKIN